MKVLDDDSSKTSLELSRKELSIIRNAIVEVCREIDLP